MLFRMSYAYDVPRYFDFVVEANSKEEAEKLAEQAMTNGLFEDADAVEPESFDKHDERTFVENANCDADEQDYLPTLQNGALIDHD